jgi:hypothetical protein
MANTVTRALLAVLLAPALASATIIVLDPETLPAHYPPDVRFVLLGGANSAPIPVQPFDDLGYGLVIASPAEPVTVGNLLGFGMFFARAVQRITVTVQQIGKCIEPGIDAAEWYAFDASGAVLDTGQNPSPGCFDAFDLHIPGGPDLAAVVFGASDGSDIITLRRLELRLVSVPAPDPAVLMLVGLIALIMLRLRLG